MKRILLLILLPLFLIQTGCVSEPSGEVYVPRGENIVIALLDTGISTTAIESENVLPGWNYVTDTDDTEDRINHGTAVTSVILGCESAGVEGISPDTYVVPLVITDKVDGETMSVTPDVLAEAIRDSVDKHGAHIINVSLGIRTDDPALREAIVYVQDRGALVTAAVGNSGERDEFYYPAAYEGVLAVGSHDKDLRISDFTQQNGTADILAPGEDIWLASRNGKTYGARGTSYAVGYVSAYAALIWKNKQELSGEDVKKEILDGAAVVDGLPILNIPSFDETEN